jgi:hypothetical protein
LHLGELEKKHSNKLTPSPSFTFTGLFIFSIEQKGNKSLKTEESPTSKK